jgi:hypothetical protein
MTLRRGLLPCLVLAVAVLMPDAASAQCAMCRRALQSPEGQQMIAAFRGGILVLIAAPFATFATVAVLAVRMQRRREAAAGRLRRPALRLLRPAP